MVPTASDGPPRSSAADVVLNRGGDGGGQDQGEVARDPPQVEAACRSGSRPALSAPRTRGRMRRRAGTPTPPGPSISRCPRQARTTSRTATVASTTSSTGNTSTKTRSLPPPDEEPNSSEYTSTEAIRSRAPPATRPSSSIADELGSAPAAGGKGQQSERRQDQGERDGEVAEEAGRGDGIGTGDRDPGVAHDRHDAGRHQQHPRTPVGTGRCGRPGGSRTPCRPGHRPEARPR